MKFRLRKNGMWRKFVDLCFPPACVMCGEKLPKGARFVCDSCCHDLPRTNLHLQPKNRLVELFSGLLPIERATGFIYYSRGSESRSIMLNLKYYHTPEIGVYMGRLMASEISDGSNFFDGIDAIVPIPLARRRMRQRGYNQVEALARGVSSVTGIPVLRDVVVRTIDNPSQTTVVTAERVENVKGIFSVSRPEQLQGKHILLMDDVVTTGSTLKACGEVIATVDGVKISVLTLAMAPSIQS